MAVLQHNCMYKLVRFEISPNEFPAFLEKGIGKNGHLQRTEKLAINLIKNNFLHRQCALFVKSVCLWGGDPRIGGKVIANNKPYIISGTLREAYWCSCSGDIAGSLNAVTSLKGLSVSFGSKHLKFLDPDRNVVLDSIIRQRFGYTNDTNGYLQWLATCHEFRRLIRDAGVRYPGIGHNGWRVSDIEMAIFNKIQSE